MTVKKGEIPQTNRVPANKLLLDFLKENNLVIISDETSFVNEIEKDTVYTVDKRPRIRVYYSDQLPKESATNGDSTPKVDVVQ